MEDPNNIVPEQLADPAPKKVSKKKLAQQEKQRKQWAVQKQAQRERGKVEVETAEIEGFASQEACSKSEAKDILRSERHLTQGYTVDAVYFAGMIAARRLGLIPTRFFWRNGVLNTLNSIRDQRPYYVSTFEDVKAEREVFRVQDLHALWDFGCSYRDQKDGGRISFEKYKELRALRSSPCKFGNTMFDYEFEEHPQGQWEKFFPPIDTNVLPENYSLKEFNKALLDLSEIHEYLLMSSRNSLKTYWITTYLLCLICTFYDCRVMLASATTQLSKDTVKKFKDFFIVQNDDPTLFQQVFAEVCLYNDEQVGSVLTYECPAARLHLAQPSLFAVGLDSTVAGRRCSHFVCDDLSDNTNSDTPELRTSTQRKFELMAELVEANSGYKFLVGTPYARQDLLFTAIERNDRNTEKSLAVRIDPAFIIKDKVRRQQVSENPQLLYEVQKDEVELMYPTRLNWGYLKRKLNTTELKTFLQQQLLVFTADGEGNIRLNFELEKLQAAVLQRDQVPASDPDTQIVLSLDRAYSTKRYADRSSLSVTKTYKNKDGQWSLCLLWNSADRWPTSELGRRIVEAALDHKVHLVVIEKDNAWRDLAAVIKLESDKRGVELPIFWKPVTTNAKSKVIRFKALEGLLGTGRLTFVSGPWIEDLFGEFTWQDGQKVSSTSQKDDRIDSLSIAALLLPAPERTDESKLTEEARERAEEAAALGRQYQSIFGVPIGSWRSPTPTPAKAVEDYPLSDAAHDNPIYRELNRFNKNPQTGGAKPLSFGYMKKIPHR